MEHQSLLQPTTQESYNALTHDGSSSSSSSSDDDDNKEMSLWNIMCILSTAFTYGCIMTTLFLITLPSECQRINKTHANLPKSVALGIFVAIAGVTQLVSPLVGRLSDSYRPPLELQVGQRLPFFVVGSICCCGGLLGQMAASFSGFWIYYSLAFVLDMIGLNVQYAMMLALLADQVPSFQIGIANGILAFLLVTGSICGFGLFHSFLQEDVHNMYGVYVICAIVSSILTGTHAQNKDAALTFERFAPQPAISANEGLDDSTKSTDTTTSLLPAASPLARKRSKRWRRAARKAAKRAQEIVLTPAQLLTSMLEPLQRMSRQTLLRSYTIDVHKHHDFFVVTVSRLFYYCGMSVQTFFLYFVHDILHITDNPQAVVASLAILGQCSGALTCYPVGVLSDRFCQGRRRPFVYVACAVLSMTTLAVIFVTTLDQMRVLCLILGAANGMYLTMETSLAVDTLHEQDEEAEEQKIQDDEEEGNARLLGLWGLAAFLGAALGPMVGGPLLYFFGSSADKKGDNKDAEEYTLAGYTVVLSLSSVYFFCSALALWFVRKAGE